MTSQTVNLVPETVNLALYGGDGASLRLTVKKSDGSPWDLTGTVKAQIRADKTDANPLASFAVNLTSHATGVALLSLTGAQTSDLVAGGDFEGFWDVQWAASGAEPVTVMQGTVTCVQDVTR